MADHSKLPFDNTKFLIVQSIMGDDFFLHAPSEMYPKDINLATIYDTEEQAQKICEEEKSKPHKGEISIQRVKARFTLQNEVAPRTLDTYNVGISKNLTRSFAKL